MFIKSRADSTLDAEILTALEELKTLRDDPNKYDAAVARLTKLQELKSNRQIKSNRLKPPSMDTVLVVGANIFGILWLARFERDNVITAPNAFRSVIRPRM